jgi:peptidoglycan/xylan/chitin deacetylase (PgdA/CDA1 family)
MLTIDRTLQDESRGFFVEAPSTRLSEPTLPWFPILMLHRVVEETPRPNPYNLCMSQRDLARVIGFLRDSGYTMSTLEDAFEAWRRGEPVERVACLTFDDGYRDFYTHSLPVLESLRCPASVYVVTRRLGETNTWDALSMPEAQLLTESEIRELDARGVRFGVHSATHPRLSRLTPEERIGEIAGAKRDLEDLLDREAEVFCYPHWDQDANVRAEVLAAGYKAALGGEQPAHEPSLLHRVDLGRLDELSLRYRLHGWRHKLYRHPAVHNAKGAAKRLLKRG